MAYNGATCASDQILKKSGANWTCQDYGGGGGTPGGADTQVQFNNGGSFTGDAGLIYNSSTDSLIVSGTIYATSTQLGSSNLNLASNENLLYGNIDTASQGNLLLLQTEGSDMFKVDSVGTSTIKGNLVLSRNPNGYRKIYAQDNSGAVMNATGLKIFGGSAVSCFAAETKITTPDGVVAIKDLKAGDKVVSYDPDQKKYVTTKIKEVFVRPADNYYVLNGIIRVTSEHPFYTKTGWKTVRELMPNDELFTSNGWQPVVSKVFVNQSLTVYNMHVDEPNTYFAEGVLVHNKAPGNGGDVYLYGGRASGRVNNDYQGYIGPSDGRMGNVVLGHDGTNPFGSVGIETNDPQYGFDVATLTRFQGSVGIGTAPPQGIILDVAGDANFRGMLGIEGTLVPTGGILIADGHGDGKVLTSDAYGMATWQNSAGGGGNPAGNDGELQFNNSGSFGADPKLKFYSAVDELWLNTRVRAKYLWVAPYSPAGWNSDGDGYFSHNVHVGGSLIVTGFTATGTVALPTGAITSAMILNSTITGTDIANSTITGTKIAASTINGSNIAAGTITGSNISTATSLTVATSYVGGMTQLGNSTPALVAGQNLLYGNISGSSSGGNLILLQNNFADKFSVDKDGNTTIGGTLDFGYEQVTGSLIGNCGQASCSAGKKVISGGVNCSASNITASYPNSDSSWTGCCSGTGSNVYAVCGRIKTGGTGG
ncbi:MAG: Hint domain-containing protein [Candidatus Komeilibacteria bacterium]|nr:Hint domain-containing protein [Candidatus Komeilibacteria bacterium]